MLPLGALVAFLALPYLTREDEPVGGWFLSAIGRRSATVAAALALLVTPLVVLADEVLGNGRTGFIAGGLLPMLVILAALTGFFVLLRRRLGASVNEAAQGLAVLLLVAFVVLTLIGVWFRGPGMALAWPWAQ